MNNSKLNNNELINLQKSFRNGEIKESEIPKQHLNQLKKLYYEQIDFLENSIKLDKEKILSIKQSL